VSVFISDLKQLPIGHCLVQWFNGIPKIAGSSLNLCIDWFVKLVVIWNKQNREDAKVHPLFDKL
jgi:hypothetical protein